MKEKHSDADVSQSWTSVSSQYNLQVKCIFCVENQPHPKLARGETYSCGYKPYRCDLCRYSTTTKGNLSIHMQSDKHLHAVQELPNSIGECDELGVIMSMTLINSFNAFFSEFAANFACGAPVSRSSPIEESDGSLICLICGIYATESIPEMLDHVEKDRSRTYQGDVTVMNGNFRCYLCPYQTTLKANFQLHTRTDKHLQKVQTVSSINFPFHQFNLKRSKLLPIPHVFSISSFSLHRKCSYLCAHRFAFSPSLGFSRSMRTQHIGV